MSNTSASAGAKTALSFSVQLAPAHGGKDVPTSELLGGKVSLLVNVASQCGLTPQYKGLEELHQKYKDRGFQVIGFPCNQFGAQEPGTDEEVNDFVCTKFKATFPLTKKVEVNGANAHPLWAFMKSQKKELMMEAVKWNFSKFLIGKNGEVIERFAPTTSPEAIASYIEKAL
jgi:glutathione peroxidase